VNASSIDVFRDRAARVLVLHALAKALLDSRAHYQALLERIGQLRSKPVLIVWGMKDSAFQPYQLDRWQQLLPEAAVARIAGAGHWPHEEEPARVIDALRRLLDHRDAK
jgi:haloalkane dehalogenase